MSIENFGVKQTFKAAADYSTKQYYLMYISAAHTVTICGAAGAVIGIMYGKPEANQYGDVLTANGVFAKVKAGGTVSAGDLLESNASGAAVAFTYDSDGDTETYAVGRAVNSGATGAIITVLTSFAPAGK
jgi:hypothetical protein